MSLHEEEAARADRYANALNWIRMAAMMHYIGGAFEPDHMRALANMAADALNGRELPDYAESWAEAQEHARELADKLCRMAEPDEDDEDEGASND